MKMHSRVGASVAPRFMKCAASIRLSENIEKTTSVYALEGNCAHDFAEDCYLMERAPHDCIGKELSLLGPHILSGPNAKPLDVYTTFVTEEMADAVAVYLNLIREICVKELKGHAYTVYVEKKFHLKLLHPDLYGTSDCVICCPDLKLIIVIDFKYGAGKIVEVEDNAQLQYYGVGALLDVDFVVETVELIIVQPRIAYGEPIKREKISSMALIDFAGELVEAAKLTEALNFLDVNKLLSHPADILTNIRQEEKKLNKTLICAGDHCQFCPVAGLCPLLHENAQTAAKLAFSQEVIQTYSSKQLGERLRELDELAEKFHAYEKSLYAFAMGYENMELGEWEIKSPAQLETYFKKLKDKNGLQIVEEAQESVSSGYNLVSESKATKQKVNAGPQAHFKDEVVSNG